jgi:glycosyltransferase involved in cell wall biosynthesis
MKVAIVHDYLFQYGGAEKCVDQWLNIYPDADIYTAFSFKENFQDSPNITKSFDSNKVYSSFAQQIFKIPFLKKFQKHLYWLYPFAMSFFNLKDYDFVIISASFCGKNIHLDNCKKVIFYCYTPTRFLYNLVSNEDQKTIPGFFKMLMKIINYPLKIADQKAVNYLKSKQVEFISISKFIQNRVKKYYHAETKVIYPPVELKQFNEIVPKQNLDIPYYIYFGRISFHKRLDLVIQACLNLNKKLIIVGSSALKTDMDHLKKIVIDFESKNHTKKGLVDFVGRVSNEDRNNYISKAKAMIFPAREDFGIAPVEALAAGLPVIAYEAGGALEYIQHKVNGYFFEQQTTESLQKAILEFEGLKLDPKKIKETAEQFSEESFRAEFEV